MAITDPAWSYIESQKPNLIDFVFRLTGDRSRASVVANEVCDSVHRELMSSWSQQDIRVELFAYAFESNSDVFRGIERSFFEPYYRNQFDEPKKVAVYYPLELFLVDLGPTAALVATLAHRFHFSDEDIARIMDRSLEEVLRDQTIIREALKKAPKIKIEEAKSLPVYDFLALPEQHPTAISHLLVDLKDKPSKLPLRVLSLLALLGFIVGFVIYQLGRFLAP